jgi:hypothetical protein
MKIMILLYKSKSLMMHILTDSYLSQIVTENEEGENAKHLLYSYACSSVCSIPR